MKKLRSILIASAAVVGFAALVFAAVPGPLISLQTILDAINLLPPVWSQVLPVGERFVLVMGGAGVLDKETGLVWEQAPGLITKNWVDAQVTCNLKAVGSRKGWRVPSVNELASLLDPNRPAGNPDLPANHPFTNVQNSIYWSATPAADEPIFAWEVNFFFSDLAGGPERTAKDAENYVWCVRGGIDPK